MDKSTSTPTNDAARQVVYKPCFGEQDRSQTPDGGSVHESIIRVSLHQNV